MRGGPKLGPMENTCSHVLAAVTSGFMFLTTIASPLHAMSSRPADPISVSCQISHSKAVDFGDPCPIFLAALSERFPEVSFEIGARGTKKQAALTLSHVSYSRLEGIVTWRYLDNSDQGAPSGMSLMDRDLTADDLAIFIQRLVSEISIDAD